MIEPWMVLAGILITAAGSYGAARYAGRASVRVKEIDVTAQAYTQADTITKGLIERLEKQVVRIEADRENDKREHAEELAKRDVRLDVIEKEVREVREHNNALTRYCYRLIDILRAVGHGEKIPTPPPQGIHL